MKKYSEALLSWCEKTCEIFEWDFEAEEKEFKETGRITIYSDEYLKRATQKAMAEAHLNPGRNIIALYNLLKKTKTHYPGWLNYEIVNSANSLSEENIIKHADYLYHLFSLKKMYNQWCNTDLNEALNNLYGKIEINNNFKFNPNILVDINELINKNHFNIYKYVDGEDEIYENDKFYLSNTIGFSSDLTSYLEWVKKNKTIPEKIKDGNIFVTLFGCLDQIHPLYSNWIFTLHKGNTIWLVTDQMNFDNPYQKELRLDRKSVWDERDGTYELCDLPYQIFHEIEEERKSNKNLSLNISKVFQLSFNNDPFKKIEEEHVKNKISEILNENNIAYTAMMPLYSGDSYFKKLEEIQIRNNGILIGYWKRDEQQIVIFSGPEIFFKRFDDLETGYKVFSLLLIDEILEWLKTNGLNIPKVILAKDFIEQKLLDNKKINPNVNETKMKYWDERQEKIFIELQETIDNIAEEPTKALTLQDYSLVNYTSKYDANTLLTPQKQESISEWLILNDIAENIKKTGIDKLKGLKEEGENWLFKYFDDNFDEIIERLFIANNINFYTNSFGIFGGENCKTKSGYVINCAPEKKSVYDYRGIGIGKTKDKYHKEYCHACGNSHSKKVKYIKIRFYKELMWILGIEDRMKLHPYFQNFRAHNLIPYAGNSLLDQTHPYLNIKDPLSKEKANGLEFYAYTCGHCKNKLSKKSKKTIDIELENL